MVIAIFVRRAAIAAVVGTSALTAACGARGPLDISVVEVQEQPESGLPPEVDAAPVAVEAGPDAAAHPVDAAADDAPSGFPPIDAGVLVNCGTCLSQQCGTQIGACLMSSACFMTLQCAATMCLSGGAPNIQCVLGCSGGDPQATQDLIGVFGCVAGKCSECLGALGGLGGLGGG